MIRYIIFENEFFLDIKPVIFPFGPCISVRCPDLCDRIEHGGLFVSTERLVRRIVSYQALGFKSERGHHRVVVEGTLQEFVSHTILRDARIF